MRADTPFRFSPSLSTAVERCWAKADVPAEWNLSSAKFEAALATSVSHRFSNTGTPAKDSDTSSAYEEAVESSIESLHARDFALACACRDGNSQAWDYFVVQFRPELYRAARAIAGEARGRELADSLYAELYGLREADGVRKSLFEYFHGRSKLTTWLRAILAQRYVDELRRSGRFEALDDCQNGDSRGAALADISAPSVAPDPEREKYLVIMQVIVTNALNALNARDRLRLAYYYVDERTLAQIGKLLSEHEATVSRKLERTRRDVRKRVETALRDERSLSDAQMKLCFDYARQEWPFDLTGVLSGRE